MKIFVSHALTDHDLIVGIKRTLEPHGIQLFIAEHYQELIGTITSKIENMIRSSDVALLLLTENGFNSNFVQQEIGYINSCKKPFLQVVQLGLEKKITGFNFGHDYISYNPSSPVETLNLIRDSLLVFWRQEEQKVLSQKALLQHFNSLRIENERRENEAKIAIGVLAGLLALGLGTK